MSLKVEEVSPAGYRAKEGSDVSITVKGKNAQELLDMFKLRDLTQYKTVRVVRDDRTAVLMIMGGTLREESVTINCRMLEPV